MDVNEIKNKKRTPKEALVYNLIVLVCVVVVVALMAVCRVGAWVPFVALCLWAMKITLDAKVILKNYIGAAVGLCDGLSSAKFGNFGHMGARGVRRLRSLLVPHHAESDSSHEHLLQ